MITHTTTHTYDPDYGFVTAIQTASVQDLHFDYYNESNEPQQNIQSRTHFGLQETFSYDNANRLTGSVVEQHDPIVVDYDANGNIQYKSNVGTYDYTSSSDEYPNPYAVKGITNPPTGVDEIERLELSYTPFNKIESILQTTGNKTAEFTYGPDEQRRKMVLKENGTDYKTTYYVGAYEKEITPEGVRELHYIGGSAVYVINSDGNSDMYYIYKDHLGSITDITDHEGTVIESLSYDAWGNRRNPDTWEYDNNLQNFLFDRGFTGHACAERSRSKHLDDFAIINMNGRIYDPLTGRMMAPDNYVQSSLSQNLNRYSYCMNNPL
ncbi:MAG: RHS repeat domain-containing protein, partial [Bacteroidota bacterium]